MCIKGHLLRGDALRARAEELCVSHSQLYTDQGIMDEAELQRRVNDAERSIRDSQLWKLAVLSAVVSVFSAAAAWVAIWKVS